MGTASENHEHERLDALRRLGVLDTGREPLFDGLTASAAAVFGVPSAAVSLVDEDREWFKSCVGEAGDGGDRGTAFCAHTILSDEVLVVEDTTLDPRFRDNPKVVRDGVRFYAGAPIVLSDGSRVGAFCIRDTSPRAFPERDREVLRQMAVAVAGALEYRAKALRSEGHELQMRRVLELLDQSAIVSVTDAHGVITHVNQTFCEISGYTREELVGEDHRILNSGDHPPAFWEKMYRDVLDGRTWHGLVKNCSKSGEIYWVQSAITGVFGPDGALREMIAIRFDVTPLKRTQASLKRASAAKTDFLSVMSHELRTPLTSIIGYAEELQSPGPGGNPAEMGETIVRNARHLLALINEILDMTKIESGKMTLSDEPYCPARMLEDIGSMLGPTAVEKGLGFEIVGIDQVRDQILGDQLRTRQILLNLIGNAIKFTATGSVRVVAERAEDYFTVEVHDTGVGMNQDQIGMVFKAFNQGERSTARTFGGSGLGLSISSSLAEMMGGSIGCESEPGRGSVFRFWAPARPAEPSTGPSVTAPRAVGGIDGRILLVEDGEDNRRLIGMILGNAGATIETAENGRIGLEMALAHWRDDSPFDLVLMDLQMPEMDGLTAQRELRKAGYPGPVLALTANAFEDDRQSCMAAGFDQFLTKPIDRAVLIGACRTWIGRARAA